MNIGNVKYLDAFELWGIPKASSLIVGSAVLALYGIRENIDLDVVVTVGTFRALRFERGLDFTCGKKSGLYKYRTFDGKVEIFGNFLMSGCVLSDATLRNALKVDGYNFFSLRDLLDFKRMRLEPHDIDDIKLIGDYII